MRTPVKLRVPYPADADAGDGLQVFTDFGVVRARNSAGTAEKNTFATKPKRARTTTAAATAVEFAGQRRR